MNDYEHVTHEGHNTDKPFVYNLWRYGVPYHRIFDSSKPMASAIVTDSEEGMAYPSTCIVDGETIQAYDVLAWAYKTCGLKF